MVGASSLSSIKTLKIPFGAESELVIKVFTGLRAWTLNSSLVSSITSSTSVKVTTLLVSPGAKLTVSLNALKSWPATAWPSMLWRSMVIVLPEAWAKVTLISRFSLSAILLLPEMLTLGASSSSKIVTIAVSSWMFPGEALLNVTRNDSSFSSNSSFRILMLIVFSVSFGPKVTEPDWAA